MKLFMLKILKSFSFLFRVPYAGDRLMELTNKARIWDNTELEVTTNSGIKMFLTLKDWVQKNIFLFGCYEKKETKFWNNMTRNKKLVLDIGANVGYYGLIAAANMRGTGMVYGFEPVSFIYERAKYNAKINNLDNLILINQAAGDIPGEISINVGNDANLGMSGINTHNYLSGKTEKVGISTIDEFVLNNKIRELNLVKIDVEGSEIMVLKGMTNTLRELKPFIMMEILDVLLQKSGSSKEEVYNLLGSYGYEAYRIMDGTHVKRLLVPESFDGLTLFKNKSIAFDEFVKVLPQ